MASQTIAAILSGQMEIPRSSDLRCGCHQLIALVIGHALDFEGRRLETRFGILISTNKHESRDQQFAFCLFRISVYSR